jgi:hypothetical protein
LDGVVGLARRAKHPAGERRQPGALLLEARGEPVAVLHGYLGHIRRSPPVM